MARRAHPAEYESVTQRGARVSSLEHDSGHTSVDRRLEERHPLPDLNYHIVAQSANDVQDIENAPAVSMVPYLLKSGQIRLLTTISVYSRRGESREQLRLLYMNSVAIQIWEEMGRAPKIIGAQFRPPRTALLTFGVPFSKIDIRWPPGLRRYNEHIFRMRHP